MKKETGIENYPLTSDGVRPFFPHTVGKEKTINSRIYPSTRSKIIKIIGREMIKGKRMSTADVVDRGVSEIAQ